MAALHCEFGDDELACSYQHWSNYIGYIYMETDQDECECDLQTKIKIFPITINLFYKQLFIKCQQLNFQFQFILAQGLLG